MFRNRLPFRRSNCVATSLAPCARFILAVGIVVILLVIVTHAVQLRGLPPQHRLRLLLRLLE
jgi:hypothetical protein